MKCDFCTYDEAPSSLPSMARHLSSEHSGLSDCVVVWREEDICLTSRELMEDEDIVLEFYIPGTIDQIIHNPVFDEEAYSGELDSFQSREELAAEEDEEVSEED